MAIFSTGISYHPVTQQSKRLPFVWLINGMLFDIEGHIALDRNAGPGYNTLLLRFIPDLYSECPQRQFHTLHGHLHSPVALHNSWEAVCRLPFLWRSLYIGITLCLYKTGWVYAGKMAFQYSSTEKGGNRARKSRDYFAWRYEIHGIIISLGTVRAQPRLWGILVCYK